MDFVDLLSHFFRFTNGGRVAFNPILPAIPKLEKKIIENTRKYIVEEYLPVFDQHTARINYCQRHFGNQQTKFFQWKFPGYYDWEPELKFRNAPRVRLARFKVSFSDGSVLTGYLNALDGVFCNISFSDHHPFYDKKEIIRIEALSGEIIKKTRKQ